MQQVYRAIDKSFNREVALKLPKNVSAEKRFARSAQVSAKITHPNVAKTLDYFEEKGTYFLIEEFIEGVNLEDALKQTFLYFDPHLAAQFIHKFAKGLAAAHHAGVFHRDLKPSNIMVASSEWFKEVKITDFGVAKMAQHEIDEAVEKGGTSLTGSQTAIGTLPYMAPELIENAKGASLPADIWALGAILYRLISGDYPFGTGLKAIPKIVKAELPDKPKLITKPQFSETGEALWAIIKACLAQSPEERPTADAVVSMCSELCYSVSPRFKGDVYNVNVGPSKVCFMSDEADEDYMFHRDSFYGNSPVVGTKVMAASYPGSPRKRAFPVLPLRD